MESTPTTNTTEETATPTHAPAKATVSADPEKERQKIVAAYQKIYDFIFTYSIFAILIIGSFIAALSLKPRSFANENDIAGITNQGAFVPSLNQSGDTYIARNIMLAPSIPNSPFDISILQGFLSLSPEAQMGYGALVQRSGIVLPISINLINHEDNYTKEFFSTATYSPEDLDTYIQNTILTYPVRNLQTRLFQYNASQDIAAALPAAGAPTDNQLRESFGLQCLSSWHLTNFFCYKNTQLFISRIPYMSFENNITELSSLVGDILKTPYKKPFCDNLLYTFSKTASSNRQRELIFSECGETYMQSYHRIMDFATVTYELQGISNIKLYADDDINIFKLLSLQQKIYQNTLQKNYDVGTIDVYLSFVQDLLTKRPNIDQIYKDITYLYNNKYLQSILTQIAIRNNNTKAMLRLTDVIKSINEGSTHLQRMIVNTGLVAFINASKDATVAQTNLVTFQDLFASKFSTFENFIVTNQQVDNETFSAEVEGFFLLNNGQKKVPFIGKYLYKDDNFILAEALFPQNDYLELSLNKLIVENTRLIDIAFVYEYIRNNSADGGAVKTLTICDVIAARIGWKECNPREARLERGDYSVLFSFDGYKITNISTNDDILTQQLIATLNGSITTQENIGLIIRDLMKDVETYNSNK